MSNRSSKPGWSLEVRDDPSKRRGIWVKETPDGGRLGHASSMQKLELCSGREGDDCYISLAVGQVLTSEDLYNLRWLVAHGRAPDVDYIENDHLCEDLDEAIARSEKTA